MSETIPPPKRTLYDVMNVIMAAVGVWIVSGFLGRDVGQLFLRRVEDVRAMWQRFEAGTLPRPAPRAAMVEAVAEAVDAAAAAGKQPRATPRLLPREFGWLLKQLEYRAGYHTAQLNDLLCEPGFGAFLEEFPNVARRLRPVCRAFGVDTDLLRLPRKAREVRPYKPYVRKPSYRDYEYRDWRPGDHWIMRIYKRGIRYIWVKDSVLRDCSFFVPNQQRS